MHDMTAKHQWGTRHELRLGPVAAGLSITRVQNERLSPLQVQERNHAKRSNRGRYVLPSLMKIIVGSDPRSLAVGESK
jgi:hypothetical protein